MGFCEERKKIRSCYFCSCRTPGCQALGDLLYPFLHVSLMCQCPATQERTERSPVRKSLFLGEADGRFGALLGRTHLTTELMEHGSQAQGISQAKGVHTLLRQRYRLTASRQPLVRIAEMPQCPSGIAMTHHPRVFSIEECRATVLLGIVERHPLRMGCVRQGDLSQVEQCPPQDTMRHQEPCRVLGLLCECQELFSQCMRRLQL